MYRNRVIGALAVLACCLTPLAACDDARNTTAQGTTTVQKIEPEQETQAEPEPQEERPTAEDPQAIVDVLQVGSDGSSDTMDDVPHSNMYDTWMECMPHNQVDGMRWVTGPQAEYIRLTSSAADLPYMFDCAATATGMPDDVRQTVTDSQDGQWHTADWDGYQALWQRSSTQSDVVIRMQ